MSRSCIYVESFLVCIYVESFHVPKIVKCSLKKTHPNYVVLWNIWSVIQITCQSGLKFYFLVTTIHHFCVHSIFSLSNISWVTIFKRSFNYFNFRADKILSDHIFKYVIIPISYHSHNERFLSQYLGSIESVPFRSLPWCRNR